MNKWLQLALALAALIVAGAIVLICWKMYVILGVLETGATQTFNGLNQALDTVNKPCAPGPCGTLANADKTMVKIGDILVTSQKQERDIAIAAKQNMAAVNGLANHLNATADALTETAHALSGTAQEASVAIGTANESLKGLQPLEASLTATTQASTATINTFNGRLSDPRVDTLMTNFASMSTTTDQMLKTANAVELKATNSYLHPSHNPFVRTWQVASPFLVAGAKITATVF